MKTSTDAAYSRDNFILQFLDAECVPEHAGYTQQCIIDINEEISEYGFLLQYAIDIGDKEQIAMIKAEIQHAKAKKRKIKGILNNRLEIVPA